MAFDSLYSCMIIEPRCEQTQWRLFSYGRSQIVCGSTKPATPAHTNLTRPGDCGLPMAWSADIERWRASTNLRLHEPLLDWAAETWATLRYNDRNVTHSPLLDILMAPQPLYSVEDPPRGRPLPLQLRENLCFEVAIESPPTAMQPLLTWLVDATPSGRMWLWIWLEGVVRRSVF